MTFHSSVCWAALLAFISFGVVIADDTVAKSSNDTVNSEAKDKKGDAKKGDAKTGVAKKKLSEAERERLIDRLDATDAEFDDAGNLIVSYNFESMSEDLASDWLPKMEKAKGRIRWTQGYEGSAEGVRGVLMSQSGFWVHEARWLGEVEMEIEIMPMSTSAKKDIIAAVYRDKRGKQIVGTNGGTQLVKMRGTKVTKVLRGSTRPSFRYSTRTRFGFLVKNGVLETTLNGSAQVNSEKSKKFLSKLPTGHVGLIWNAQVNSVLTNVKIKGKIDPDWFRGKK